MFWVILCQLGDLSSPTRDQTQAPSSGLKLRTSSEFPTISLNATKDNDNENPSYWGMGGEAGSLLSKSNI